MRRRKPPGAGGRLVGTRRDGRHSRRRWLGDQCEERTSPPTVDLRQRLPLQGAAAARAGGDLLIAAYLPGDLSASCGSTGSLRPYGRDS
jgi:hypothetical protein